MRSMLAVLFAFALFLSQEDQDGRAPRWWDDVEEATQLALETNRPLLLVFR